jgi:hypothetical protein
MTAAEEASPSEDTSSLDLFAEAGDDSGRETFSKYRYQAKLALSFWLTTLLPQGPVRIYSEFIEDIAIEHDDHIKFCQVKTRNPGLSRWTMKATAKDGGGLDSLLRCFRTVGHAGDASFELLLEGEASTQSPTPEFFTNPGAADAAMRTALMNLLAATPRELDAWLPRLRVRPRQISRANIDDRNLVALSKMLETVAYPHIQETYDRLLTAVEELQSGESREAWWSDVQKTVAREEDRVRFLDETHLRDLLPRAPVASPGEWTRLLRDPNVSDLERKLTLAGAGPDDIKEAKDLRAIALPRIREIESGPAATADAYDQLNESLLRFAKGIARTHSDKAAPATHILGDLTRAADSDMKRYDTANLFPEHFSLAGVVCQLSDECHFPWR